MWILLVGDSIIDSAAMIVSLSQHTWLLNKLYSCVVSIYIYVKLKLFVIITADVLAMEVRLNGQTQVSCT